MRHIHSEAHQLRIDVINGVIMNTLQGQRGPKICKHFVTSTIAGYKLCIEISRFSLSVPFLLDPHFSTWTTYPLKLGKKSQNYQLQVNKIGKYHTLYDMHVFK